MKHAPRSILLGEDGSRHNRREEPRLTDDLLQVWDHWRHLPTFFKWGTCVAVLFAILSVQQALQSTRYSAEIAKNTALSDQVSVLKHSLHICEAHDAPNYLQNAANLSYELPPLSHQDPYVSTPYPQRPLSRLDWAVRTAALAVLIGILYGAFLLVRHTDNLPWPIRDAVTAKIPNYDERHPASLSKWVAYSLDHWFSTNPYSKTSSLLYITLFIIFMGSLAIFAVTGSSVYSAFWQAVEGVGIDWTFANEKNSPWGNMVVRIIAVLVSIGGMLITALLLSIVSETISARIEGLKKGHSDVLESGHTLVLGWSDKVLGLVDQLCLANASEGGRPIVILAERDKLEMEAAIRRHVPDTHGSRIICRLGNPLLSIDLERVSLPTARSTIIVASADTPDRSDARVLRTVLSLIGLHDRLQKAGLEGLLGHIVVEVGNLDNEALIQMVSPGKVHTVVSHDIIGRLMIQCARQPGLAAVWEIIMGYEDDEFYSKEWPELRGLPWCEVQLRFPAAIPIGIQSHGHIHLNPPHEYCLQPGDKVIVLAEDDDSYEPSHNYPLLLKCEHSQLPQLSLERAPEKVLFCGWRRDLNDMVTVLDEFVAPKSELWIYTDIPVGDRLKLLKKAGLDPSNLKNLRLIFDEQTTEGELVNRRHLESLNPKQFSSILLLADDSDSSDMTDADSRNLATLLLLRDIQAQAMGIIPARHKGKKMPPLTPRRAESMSRPQVPSPRAEEEDDSHCWYELMQGAVQKTLIISEILDPRTRNLIQDLHVSEYVLSNELVSMALAMVAEGPEVLEILAELFVAEGNELYIQGISQYIYPGETVNFYDVMERAQRRKEIAIGYKPRGHAPPVINPKDKEAKLLDDIHVESIVVLARGEE